MNKLIVARILHVFGFVLWIGGVSMVTIVLLPTVRDTYRVEDRVEFFEHIEHRFARQARFTTLLTGISGFYMLYVLDAWNRYTTPSFWWVHMMTITWLIFTIMLFVLEPMMLKRKLKERAYLAPAQTFVIINHMHWFLLILSLITVAGAVAGSHRWLL